MAYFQLYKELKKSYLDYPHRPALDRQWLPVYLIYRPVSFYIAPIFIMLGFSANQVTLLNIPLLAAACFYLMQSDAHSQWIGCGIFLFYAILDYVDGTIARHNKFTNYFGKLIDGFVDTLGLFIFIPIAYSTQEHFFGPMKDYGLEVAVITVLFALVLQYFRLRVTHFAGQAAKITGTNSEKNAPKKKSVSILKLARLTHENLSLSTPLLLIIALAISRVDVFLIVYFLNYVGLGFGEMVSTTLKYHKILSVETPRRN